jgi:hypothetical protein
LDFRFISGEYQRLIQKFTSILKNNSFTKPGMESIQVWLRELKTKKGETVMKHNHHNGSSMLCKFVRRGTPIQNSFEIQQVVNASFSKKEAVAICEDSPLYFSLPLMERKQLINRLAAGR